MIREPAILITSKAAINKQGKSHSLSDNNLYNGAYDL